MKVSQFLNETNWTQGAAARNQSGEPVAPGSPDATCFCLLGAMRRCYPGYTFDFESAMLRITHAIHRRVKYSVFIPVQDFNDQPGRTFDEIAEVIREAQV